MMGIVNDKDDYNFYRSTYNSDDKSIVGAYMIVGETDKMIEVMNIKETKKTTSIYMDYAIPYLISIHKIMLPKSQVSIIKPVDSMDNFFYIKIPYWLFKKLSDDLEIRRVEGKKRLTINSRMENDPSFAKKLSDPDVGKYLMVTNPDEMVPIKIKNTIARHGLI